MSVSSFGDLVGERVDLMLVGGEVWGRGRAVGFYTGPSYVVDLDEGGNGHDRTGWSASLVRPSTGGDCVATRADSSAEVDRLRARVAELETAGADMDDVLSAIMFENACRDLSLRDRTTLARGSWARAVRGER